MLLNFTSVMCQGVPVKFPNLRIAFLEIGATWLPYYLARLDEHWYTRGEVEMPVLKKKPSDIFRESHIIVSLEADEPLIPETAEIVGIEHLVFASDIPHWDGGQKAEIAAVNVNMRCSLRYLGENDLAKTIACD